jgi:hypothetical protein
MHPRLIYHLAYGGSFDILSPYFLVGLFGMLLWAVAYVLVVVQGFRMKTYGIPFAAICLNITWEFLSSFVWPRGADRVGILVTIDIIWFSLDLLIAWQLLRYGRAEQLTEGLRRWYYVVFVFGIIVALGTQYAFSVAFVDQLGLVTSYFVNLVMSILFIFRFWANGRCDTTTYLIAWAKWWGTACVAVMFYFWLKIVDPVWILRSPMLTNFLAVVIFIIDFIYVGFLWSARRALARTGQQPAPLGVTTGAASRASISNP